MNHPSIESNLWQSHPQSVWLLQHYWPGSHSAPTHWQIWKRCCQSQWRYRLLHRIQWSQLSPLRRESNSEQKMQCRCSIRISYRGGRTKILSIFLTLKFRNHNIPSLVTTNHFIAWISSILREVCLQIRELCSPYQSPPSAPSLKNLLSSSWVVTVVVNGFR